MDDFGQCSHHKFSHVLVEERRNRHVSFKLAKGGTLLKSLQSTDVSQRMPKVTEVVTLEIIHKAFYNELTHLIISINSTLISSLLRGL